MAARRYGDFRSDEVFCRGRRQYIPVGLTAASMRPTSLQKTSPDRNCSVTICVSLNNPSFRRMPESIALNSLESGMRRDDEKRINQKFLRHMRWAP